MLLVTHNFFLSEENYTFRNVYAYCFGCISNAPLFTSPCLLFTEKGGKAALGKRWSKCVKCVCYAKALKCSNSWVE